MFSTLATVIVATKIHFAQTKYKITRKNDQQVAELIYKNEVDKFDEKVKYKKSKMPESGYMTVAEYEEKSKPKTKKEISAKILDKAEFPKDEHMVYIPQHKFKLVKYNNPAGSPELSLPRKLNFDRQINAQGIVSGDYTKLVYPAVYYYAESDCTSCDLFLIKLDPKLSNLEKVQKANIINREKTPLISTSKDIDVKFVFRTLTPIDFSSDNNRIAVKEKIGYRHDGIWKTELWVYDFNKRQGTKLPQIRDAIIDYWKNSKNINLKEKRWDIYPLGFDSENDNRIIVSAYAFTGETPKFLGNWSIDINGISPRLESLKESSQSISIVGYRLVPEENVIPISEVKFSVKQAKKTTKQKTKREKADKKLENDIKKAEYKQKIQKMNMETLLKIEQRRKELKRTKVKSKDGYTGD